MPFSTQFFQDSLLRVWERLIAFLPNVIGALVVFIIGLIFAVVLQRVVKRTVALLRIDELAEKLDLKEMFQDAGIRLHIGEFLGWTVKWFLIVVTLIAATDILGWEQVTDYLQEVVLYIPNVIISVIILLAGILLGNFVRRIVKSSLDAAQLAAADVLSALAKWAILIFTFMAALVQLQIAPDLIRVLFTGLVAMLALAGGLAFGLGGKEHASRLLDKLQEDITSKTEPEETN